MKSKLRILACALACLLQSAWAQAEEADRGQDLARADGSRIRFYLDQREASAQADQLLVVIQGSDCNSVTRVEAIRAYIARVMPAADILTVEKYGIDASLPYSDDPARADCPLAYVRHDSLAQRAADLDAVIADVLRRHGYRQVVALGGSEGAVVAHLLAARSDRISATIAFNGGGRWFLDDVLHSIASAPGTPREKAESKRGMRAFARHVRTATPAARAAIAASGHGYRWWRDALDTDQLAVLQASRSPALIIQAGADDSVSPEAVLAMVARLHQAGKRNITYKTYASLDHRLRGPDGQSHMAEVVDDMAAWLQDAGIVP
ncbi:serine aminopeptidase domain-containing protein [Cupriavidus sp. USMAA2-4]|uniref:serine aminopeptidase domain-containing protein n=1 Tax=Cupriavidus sp. USMAA2-4 TaxID=876364 RepID=UPI000A65D9F3|nr:alpha/beta hydrolase [Cupriavidus sp. USMAA2-4]